MSDSFQARRSEFGETYRRLKTVYLDVSDALRPQHLGLAAWTTPRPTLTCHKQLKA